MQAAQHSQVGMRRPLSLPPPPPRFRERRGGSVADPETPKLAVVKSSVWVFVVM